MPGPRWRRRISERGIWGRIGPRETAAKARAGDHPRAGARRRQFRSLRDAGEHQHGLRLAVGGQRERREAEHRIGPSAVRAPTRYHAGRCRRPATCPKRSLTRRKSGGKLDPASPSGGVGRRTDALIKAFRRFESANRRPSRARSPSIRPMARKLRAPRRCSPCARPLRPGVEFARPAPDGER